MVLTVIKPWYYRYSCINVRAFLQQGIKVLNNAGIRYPRELKMPGIIKMLYVKEKEICIGYY